MLQNLEECTLVLWNCGIKDKGMIEFAQGFANCKNLKVFELILWKYAFTHSTL